ncbi:NAD(P)H-quinone oxidoreductase subunit 2, chloroplastic [Dyadobacter sp. CECT 9275]|uniref:NAD(P)H-quinone oxidoreductase subunit 2, chloroplastic n=1 Tax=Dyadobacter helix TaxID=2822344 RepID=A0A916NM29_9BACT|nr:proton-conducting transporter membrane subunit [Dyadobacter sp. CECT 9275]CAG5004017.1 NAD(P)H-quinone oxidoreductase subunit 2, chloroplastic [Dyadobacter sp. CECT 9275]
MILIIELLIVLPLLGFFLSMLVPSQKEGLVSRVTFVTVGIHMIISMFFLVYWLLHSRPVLDEKALLLFKSGTFEFFIDFHFDNVTATYLLVGSFLTFLVAQYSRHYLHREKGYKHFFNTILFFYTGYIIVIFSGNLETLFIGWEMLGVSSFLLIAFYRERYLPVKNAIKVFSIYRLSDLGLLLAMWASHHFWHENITFLKMGGYGVSHKHLLTHSHIGLFISLMFLVAAAAKSAQLPFSSWLPRAMEGPTPSTAIFYGSLSVHLGVFLLLRTFHFWEHQLPVRILVLMLGLVTAVIVTGIARVQASVKSQIAYASIAQIGLIFMEIALGLQNLALFHFAGNAFLRTYQLLASPSVVSYLIREQFYSFSPKAATIETSFPKRLRHTLYILCLKEWNLDSFQFRYFWNPLKTAGKKLRFLTFKRVIIIFIPVCLAVLFWTYNQAAIPPQIKAYLPVTFSFIGLLMVLKSFTERLSSRISWLLVIINHFWVALSVLVNENVGFEPMYLYLSGVVVSGILGYLCLNRLYTLERDISLDQFHGHSYKHPKMALVFLLCCLGLSGFPITPTFIGEALLFSYIREDQIVLASLTALSLITDGLAILRIYARVFLGPPVKSLDGMAYRSS